MYENSLAEIREAVFSRESKAGPRAHGVTCPFGTRYGLRISVWMSETLFSSAVLRMVKMATTVVAIIPSGLMPDSNQSIFRAEQSKAGFVTRGS